MKALRKGDIARTGRVCCFNEVRASESRVSEDGGPTTPTEK